MIPLIYPLLALLGFGAGALGTMIGAGGGFILVPILLLLFPGYSPEIITSMSLAVVLLNSLSGSAAYARMRRIDYRSGLLMAAATIPGAVIGAAASAYIPLKTFHILFGLALMGVAGFLFLSKKGYNDRKISFGISNNFGLGTGMNFFIGLFSTMMGIGGGVIHVPTLVYVFDFPVHIATATSQFVLSFVALAGVMVHLRTGALYPFLWHIAFLSIGAVLGSQLGARFSARLKGERIMRVLSLVLALSGFWIFIGAV